MVVFLGVNYPLKELTPHKTGRLFVHSHYPDFMTTPFSCKVLVPFGGEWFLCWSNRGTIVDSSKKTYGF